MVAEPRLGRATSCGMFRFQRSFARHNLGSLDDHYDLDRLLGSGTYGSAHQATCKRTGAQRAVKKVKTPGRQQDVLRLEAEISIARKVDHPNIVRLFETFQDAEGMCLVMELCTGGELFERIIHDAPQGFEETKAASLTQQMLSALCYLHAIRIVHRDVKPENFLLSGSCEGDSLKLIDFGLASEFTPGQPLATRVGTPYYVAPEVLRGEYDEKCDIWSAGVITYVMLCGYPPFHGSSDREVLRRVRRGSFDFPSPDWDGVSNEAKAHVSEALTLDPVSRPSAEDALTALWLFQAEDGAWSPGPIDVATGADVVARLQAFRAHARLKRVALAAIARQLSDEEIRPLLLSFRALDLNGDGMLSPDELWGPVEAQESDVSNTLHGILGSVDSDGSGSLDYTEFLAATIDWRLYARRDICWAAFQSFDLDGDGKISLSELEQVLGPGSAGPALSRWHLDHMIREVDLNGDGCVDFGEFLAMMADGRAAHAGVELGREWENAFRRAPKGHPWEASTVAAPEEDKARGLSGGSWSTAPSSSGVLDLAPWV